MLGRRCQVVLCNGEYKLLLCCIWASANYEPAKSRDGVNIGATELVIHELGECMVQHVICNATYV